MSHLLVVGILVTKQVIQISFYCLFDDFNDDEDGFFVAFVSGMQTNSSLRQNPARHPHSGSLQVSEGTQLV